MITPNSLEEIASYVEQDGKKVFVFSADWCGDCRYLKPFLPEIEAENPEFTFILIDRDAYMDLAKVWDFMGSQVWWFWKRIRKSVGLSIGIGKPKRRLQHS